MKLIDSKKAIKALTHWETEPTDEEIIYTINNLPTVEAIPVTEKAFEMFETDYKNRLKADLEAILVELQLKIEENGIVDFEETYVDDGECIISVSECTRLIQQKINELF